MKLSEAISSEGMENLIKLRWKRTICFRMFRFLNKVFLTVNYMCQVVSLIKLELKNHAEILSIGSCTFAFFGM
jgi:hypothetical protein